MTPTGFAKALSVCLLQWNDGPGAKPRTQGRGWARGRGPGPPPTPGAGATGPERLLPRGGGRSRAQIRCRCPISRGEARVPTPETRPRRGQSTGPAVMRACRRARPGDGPAAAWGPGAGGLAVVSSPHLPKGTGGKCSALLHKRGRGLRGFPGSRPSLASRRRWRHLPALLQGCRSRTQGRVALCTGSHKGAAGRGHQGGAS